MNCDNCEFADWKRAANGRLHPDKSGRCTRLEKHPLDLRLPAVFIWRDLKEPTPLWGDVKRGQELRSNCQLKSVKR